MVKKDKIVKEVVDEVKDEEVKDEIVSDKEPVMRMIGGRMRQVN